MRRGGHKLRAVGDIAFKVDPTTGTVEDSYNGPTDLYTYSDMTGYAG